MPGGLGGGCVTALYINLVSPTKAGGSKNRATVRNFVNSYFHSPPSVPPPPSFSVPPPPARVPPPPLDNYKQVRGIQELALKACGSPDAISVDDLFEAGLLTSSGEVYGAADAAANLSGCQRFVFDRIIEFYRSGKRVNRDILVQWAAQSRIVPVTPRRGDREDPEPHRQECTGGEDFYHPRMCPGN